MSGKNDELEKVIVQYSSMLYKICFLILKNEQDTKDVLQETFLTFYIKKPTFYNDEHRKAWLIKVSQNKCREFLRFHKKHANVSWEEMEETHLLTSGLRNDEADLLALIWNLDYKMKSVVILYYIEGYSVEEIAGILKISQAAVKKRMQRARQELKIGYIGEVTYEEKKKRKTAFRDCQAGRTGRGTLQKVQSTQAYPGGCDPECRCISGFPGGRSRCLRTFWHKMDGEIKSIR